MMLKFCSALVVIELILAFRPICGSLLLPEQYHCSSELGFLHKELHEGDTYFVDEYVDRPNRRSSLRLVDSYGDDFIYFNNLFGKDEGPVDRQFELFDPKRMLCRKLEIHDWYLDKVRKIAIGILPADQVSPKNVDIAIGPSGLLFAVESRMDELKYRGSVLDQSRLVSVAVFEAIFENPYGSYGRSKVMLVQVSVLAAKGELPEGKLAAGKSLSELAQLVEHKLEVVTVKVCSVKAARVHKEWKAHSRPYQCKVDLLAGPEQELVASFDLLEDLRSDSLIGQPLEKAGQFEFGMNPFAMPVGLGCGKRLRASQNNLSSIKTFKAQSERFSAEYFSTKGHQGLSYVAFDGQRQVFRHDRHGRKNIYDLSQNRSYHLDAYRPSKRMLDNRLARGCVQLEIGDDMQLLDEFVSPMARLLGIDALNEASYLGFKTINDETLSVYEFELEPNKNSLGGHNLPIIMEPIDFVMPTQVDEADKRRYFMTYYVEEIARDLVLGDTLAGDHIKIPRFVELWERDERGWNSPERERSLVNQVEFAHFSWSLSVEPEEEDDDVSRSFDSSGLFSIESCGQERNNQLLLTFYTIDSSLAPDQIQANRQLIRENFHQQLATILEIPPINLLSLQVHFSPPPYSGMWIVSATIAELVRGISQDQGLGQLELSKGQAWMREAELFRGENRHSLDQCKLDSLALKRPNTLVFCPRLALCLILNSETLDEHRSDLLAEPSSKPGGATQDTCEVHRFTWWPVPTSGQDEQAVLARVLENKNRIASSNFVVELLPADQDQLDKPTKRRRYQGFGHGVRVRALDDTLGLGRLEPKLAGLRYLTGGEEREPWQEAPSSTGPFVGGSSYAYRLAERRDVFRQCHMACQLDEFCESFSVCKPNPAEQAEPCILSSMRLTGDKLSDLAETIKRRSGEDDDEISIETSTGADSSFTDDQSASYTYKFRREPGCSLHQKDILAQFRASRAIDLPMDLGSTTGDLARTNATGAQLVSLAECAGLSNELALMEQNSPEARFVYCPVESTCLTGELEEPAASTSGQPDTPKSDQVQRCFSYTKSHQVNFYDKLVFRRLTLRFGEKLGPRNESVQKVERTIVGLSLEQCARDCNLQQSNCLAFDLCEFETNNTVCSLYSIRSPLSPKIRAGYLPMEQRFYSKGASDSAILIESAKCAHFHLKDGYFQLKINHLLAGDSQAKRQRLDELERKMLDKDIEMSDILLRHIVSDQFKLDDQVKENSSDRRRQQATGGAGLMIHLALIISSATLGALSYLYGGEAITFTVDAIKYLRARQGQRFVSPRISQLGLANNQESL